MPALVLGLSAVFVTLAVRWFGRQEFDAQRIIHRLRPKAIGWAVLTFAILGWLIWRDNGAIESTRKSSENLRGQIRKAESEIRQIAAMGCQGPRCGSVICTTRSRAS